MRWLHRLLGAGFVVAVPIVLAMGSTHLLLYDPNTYQVGYARYDIARRTGLSEAELRAATASFIGYFSGRNELDVTIERGGVRRPLFNERELRHMRDVRELFWLCDRLGAGAGLYLLGFTAVGLATRRLSGFDLARLAVGGSLLTFGVGLLFGLASLLDFEALFLQFHLLSFDNDTWQLDPRRDYLIAMFPQPFWFDCAMQIAVMTLGSAALIGGAGAAYLWWRYRRGAAPAATARA